MSQNAQLPYKVDKIGKGHARHFDMFAKKCYECSVLYPPLKPMNWRKEIKGVFSASISAVRFFFGGKICSQIRFFVNFVSRKLPNPIAKIKIIIHSGGGNWCNRKKAPHKFINFRNVCKSSIKFYFRLSNLVSFRCKSTMIAEQRRTHTQSEKQR